MPGWEKWYEEPGIDPGSAAPPCRDILLLPLFPIVAVLLLVFGFLFMVVAPLIYVVWLGVKEMRANRSKQ